ncbi:unnamed protein product [Rhizoctonia solani]|uniref:Berberine/berberine-like domain-containing protein n=1 Tax=Rhizoctonia solani TaxID=456999 RepID=A0A8H3CJ12_9AGAM|nr:unnamed protein product [Rhizoctonia solani]
MTETTINSDISDALLDELRATFKGAVYRREDSGPAKLLVRPLDVYDVSEIVKFCKKHQLSPSAKSGGYGTHGWAVEGDVVIDMRLISQIRIERPGKTTPDWTSMRESPHVRVADPDTLRGSTRVPSVAVFPTTYPSDTVGPPPIHDPFTESRRRSAGEAFTVVVASTSMRVDGEEPSKEIDADRPTRKLRVGSPTSAQGSRSSADLNTPPTTNSPHTPGEGISVKPPTPPPQKSHGPATPGDVARDETLLPPTADRPMVGFDMRGFVGRDPGYWAAMWSRDVADSVALESAGTAGIMSSMTHHTPSNLSLFGPTSTFSPSLDPPVLRSTAPPSARPFDFAEPTTAEINAHANPHGNPTGNNSLLFPGLTTSGSGGPFHLTASSGSDSNTSAVNSPQPDGPTITHVPYELRAPVTHTYVTFGAGASQKDINAFCASHPLETVAPNSPGDGTNTLVADTAAPNLHNPIPSALTSGSFFGSQSTVPYYVPFAAHPVGSSVMLLGGFGFLSRLRGLSMDCLVEAEVVLADGRIVWVSATGVKDQDGNDVEFDEEELDADAKEFIQDEKERAKRLKEKSKEQDSNPTAPEESKDEQPAQPEQPESNSSPQPEEVKSRRGLWWALRGAGSAFGIVVRYKAKAFPVSVVFAGNLIYNFNKATAPSLIMHFRDCIKSAPRELYANCILTAGPRNQGALVVIQICYAGPRAEGLPFLQAISSWDGDNCLLNEVQEKEFVWQQDSIAKVLKGGSGRKWFIRSNLITSLTDEIIYRTVRKFGDTPDGCTWLFELSGGALMDTTDSCLPKAAREAAFTIVALHQWKLELDDPACVLTAEEWIRDTLSMQSTGGPFPCFLERREKRARILGSYGAENWARLCALKKKYDPDGMFRHNFWPLDKQGKPIVDPREMRNGADLPGGHRMDLTLDDRGVPLAA